MIGVLPLAVAKVSLMAGTLVIIDANLPSRGFHTVLAREREPSRAASAFLQMFRSEADGSLA